MPKRQLSSGVKAARAQVRQLHLLTILCTESSTEDGKIDYLAKAL
jgi:hypothetical protein